MPWYDCVLMTDQPEGADILQQQQEELSPVLLLRTSITAIPLLAYCSFTNDDLFLEKLQLIGLKVNGNLLNKKKVH